MSASDILDMVRSLNDVASGKYTAYPGYIASRIKRALKAADTEQIISEIGDMESLGNSAYAIAVTDFNGKTYRVTVECT